MSQRVGLFRSCRNISAAVPGRPLYIRTATCLWRCLHSSHRWWTRCRLNWVVPCRTLICEFVEIDWPGRVDIKGLEFVLRDPADLASTRDRGHFDCGAACIQSCRYSVILVAVEQHRKKLPLLPGEMA